SRWLPAIEYGFNDVRGQEACSNDTPSVARGDPGAPRNFSYGFGIAAEQLIPPQVAPGHCPDEFVIRPIVERLRPICRDNLGATSPSDKVERHFDCPEVRRSRFDLAGLIRRAGSHIHLDANEALGNLDPLELAAHGEVSV